MAKLHVYFLSLMIVVLAGCCNKTTRVKPETGKTKATPSIVSVILPKEGETFRCGDPVRVELKIHPDSAAKIDSIALSSSAGDVITYHSGFRDMVWHSDHARVGKNIIKIDIYHQGSRETHSAMLILLSDIVPVTYNYTIIAKYPHDNTAYTQGLIYFNGILYESTGLEGKSSIRKVDIKTGEPLLKIDLDDEFFGEGLARCNNLLYQLTYRSQVGFIYDLNTLQLIRRFDYPIKEGWGLTYDSKHLIMSDGSAQLFFIEPEYFTQVDQLEVFDNKGMVAYINELEYINGKVLANLYGDTRIIMIDPDNGKVTGQLNLEKLVPKGFENNSNYVLNGIAYNPQNHHLYVTGKNWPVLYEIMVTPVL